jgi:hypothetical protein
MMFYCILKAGQGTSSFFPGKGIGSNLSKDS